MNKAGVGMQSSKTSQAMLEQNICKLLGPFLQPWKAGFISPSCL